MAENEWVPGSAYTPQPKPAGNEWVPGSAYTPKPKPTGAASFVPPGVSAPAPYPIVESTPTSEHFLKALPNSALGVFKAFSSGFQEGFGHDPVGMSSENAQKMQDWGLFNKDLNKPTGLQDTFKSFNEAVFMGGAMLLDSAARASTGLFRGYEEATGAAGVPRDIGGLPEAFFGSPHPTGIPHAFPDVVANAVKRAPERPIEVTPMPTGANSSKSPAGPVYIDPSIPEKFHGPLAVHETVEQDLMAKGNSYDAAHKIATQAERQAVEAAGMDWKQYSEEIDGYLSKIEKEKPENLPSDLHVQPGDAIDHHEGKSADAGGTAPAAPAGPPALSKADILRSRELGVVGPERPSINEGTPEEAAARAIQPTIAYHGSPHDFDAFSMEKIGTGEGAQSYGHGLYFAEHPETGRQYQAGTGKVTINGMSFNPADPVHIASQVIWEHHGDKEAAIKDLQARAKHDPGDFFMRVANYVESGRTVPEYKVEGNFYQVKIHANKEDFLDLDDKTPLSEHPKKLKIFEKLWKETGEPAKDFSKLNQGEAYDAIAKIDGGEGATERLKEKGIPGNKYFDQGSRGNKYFVRPSGGGKFSVSDYNDAGHGEFGTMEEAKKAANEMNAAVPKTSNFVLFDEKLVEITHKNGEPVEPAPSSKPPVPTEKPSLPAELSPRDQAWKDRFDEFVGKLEVPQDVKDLIINAQEKQGLFPEARQGDIPLGHREPLAQAAGLPVSSFADVTGIPIEQMNARGLGRLLKNDNEVRVAMQLLLKTTDDTFEAARNADMTGDIKDLFKLQENIMRRDLALEQVVGLRAEWGRTGNVFQEFTEKVKDGQSLGRFLKDKGKYTVDDLRDIAKSLKGLNDRDAQARFLSDLRKPTLWDKFMYVWTNGLLSGLFTHARYFIGNTLFAGYDALLIAPTAGAIGAVRQAFNKAEIDRVFIGEGPARVWGILRGTEEGIIAAAQAFDTGVPTALPRQVTLNVNPYTGQAPIGGTAGRVIGLPSRAIAGIHTYYNVIGYRSQIEAEAYRSAAKAGLKPTDPDFWSHMHGKSMFPEEATMDTAVKNGSRLTFTDPLGGVGRAFQTALNVSKVGRMVVPFLRVSSNVFKAAQEGTPLAWLNSTMRDNLKGKNGEIARDTQYARMAIGSSIGGLVAYWAANDLITDSGPVDPHDHDIWRLTHEPNSVKIGGNWVGYNRIGPLGPFLGMISTVSKSIQGGMTDGASQAMARLVMGISEHVVNEVGMQGLSDLITAMRDPERYGKRYINNFAASMIPFTTGLGQWAAVMDPYQRDTQTLVDALKNKIPWERETLYPVRDWKGNPLANNREDAGAVIKNREVNTDPVDQQMSILNIRPTKVEKAIKGVQLTPEQYDHFQTIAGAMTTTALEALVKHPGWTDQPPAMRTIQMQSIIKSTRAAAETQMQMENGGAILRQHLQNEQDRLRGIKPQRFKSIGEVLGVQ